MIDRKLSCMNFNPRLREGGDNIYRNWLLQKDIFQSTPPRRRRQHCARHRMEYIKFQSTPPRRRRRNGFRKSNRSINYFNPRLREGGDREQSQRIGYVLQFQSTPPRRRRLILSVCVPLCIYFNPRLREGGDAYSHNQSKHCIFYFNPRLREGGDTFLLRDTRHLQSISIHASAKEATI